MHGLIVLTLLLAGLLGFAYGQSADKLTLSIDFQSEGDSAIISGVVKNENGEPIDGATIKFFSVIEEAETKSDLNGEFVYQPSALPANNTFNVSVKAEKEGYLTGYANTSFLIGEQNKIETENTVSSNFNVKTGNAIKNDPIASKILQNIEQNKQKEAERQKRLQEIEERERFIDEQRELARQDLLSDLQDMFVQFDPFRPQNVFSTFASQLDSTIQSIYWAQFNFTQTKTQEGLAALQQVLNNGGTEQEARKAFYEKAASSRSEINKLNEDLNSKHVGNNTSAKSDQP